MLEDHFGAVRSAFFASPSPRNAHWIFLSTQGQNIFMKLAMGMSAGGIGALVGNPAEVVLVRMTADGRSDSS